MMLSADIYIQQVKGKMGYVKCEEVLKHSGTVKTSNQHTSSHLLLVNT